MAVALTPARSDMSLYKRSGNPETDPAVSHWRAAGKSGCFLPGCGRLPHHAWLKECRGHTVPGSPPPHGLLIGFPVSCIDKIFLTFDIIMYIWATCKKEYGEWGLNAVNILTLSPYKRRNTAQKGRCFCLWEICCETLRIYILDLTVRPQEQGEFLVHISVSVRFNRYSYITPTHEKIYKEDFGYV